MSQEVGFDKGHFHQQVVRLWPSISKKFYLLSQTYVFFHVIFGLIAFLEITLFVIFSHLMGHSTILAFTLAVFFLTLFAFFSLRLYLQTKRPDLLLGVCEEYLAHCREVLSYQAGIPEHHIALASAAQKFATSLHEKEYTYYSPPSFLRSLAPFFEKWSCFCHWRSFFLLKELLLSKAIEEHLKAVKCMPTHLEIHAALANAYVTLSGLYQDPRKFQGFDEERWVPKERFSERAKEKFRKVSERAIEEFKILSDYAPEDPWVHLQLAYSYHDLQMPEQEIAEYEIVLRLQPDDKDTLFKLGMLYFQQGKNSLGLHIYETLKATHHKKAESLIKFYGSYE